MNVALVPVKRLADGKSRLLPELDAAARESLCLAMLEDLLRSLGDAKRIDRVAVVTPDADVRAVAERAGAECILFPRPGLNPAIDYAAEALGLESQDALLVVLGDVAGALPRDLDLLFAELDRLGERGAVLAPSSDGGSAALLRRPHDALPARFGRDSADSHRESAAELEIPFCERHLPSLALDLDEAADLEHFIARNRSGGERTRETLRALGWPQ